jgi:opacity protein-like surface antigen
MSHVPTTASGSDLPALPLESMSFQVQDKENDQDPGTTGAEPTAVPENANREEYSGFFAMLESEGWHYSVAPYMHLFEFDGTAYVGNAKAKADLNFSDILDYLDFGGMMRFEAHKNDWGIIVDGAYMKLSEDAKVKVGPATIKPSAEFQQANLDVAASYRFAKVELNESREGSAVLTLAGFGGVRYGYLKTDVDLGFLGLRDERSEDWLEPLVGGHANLYLSDKWRITLRGDASGFGVGSGSDLTWQIVTGVGWMPLRNVEVGAGYRYLDLDYKRGSGADTFGLDATYSGPIVGVVIHF